MQAHCWFLFILILGNNLAQFRGDDDLSVARWILALESSAPDLEALPESSSSSSSSEEEDIPSLESRELKTSASEKNEDVGQETAADEEFPTARVFIPDIGKIKTIVDILKTVGSVVVPIVIEDIEGLVSNIEPPPGELEAIRVPNDVVSFKTRGVMLLRNARKSLESFNPL
uniref:Putative secreted protein n=1 Tax=Lutzomyia longipalpis TaxID=7200 RepID=A0A1B0CKG7_LUTLO